MHTYRQNEAGDWQAGSVAFGSFQPLGPTFDNECEAAAYACYLNGGRYSPGEIEHVFRRQPQPIEDDSIHPERPKAFDNDYPIAATQRRK